MVKKLQEIVFESGKKIEENIGNPLQILVETFMPISDFDIVKINEVINGKTYDGRGIPQVKRHISLTFLTAKYYVVYEFGSAIYDFLGSNF